MLRLLRLSFTTSLIPTHSLHRALSSQQQRPYCSNTQPSLTSKSTPKMTSLWSEKTTDDIINLGRGHPSPKLLNLEEIEKAFSSAKKRNNAHVEMLQYGRMQGNEHLCKQISQFIKHFSPSHRIIPSSNNIMITNGSGPAMTVVCQLYSKPGDTVFVDFPGYFLAYYTFIDCGLNVVNIPTDQYGMDIDQVENRLKAGERPSILYTVPFGNNPTGVSMSEDRKKRLVELSREYNFKIMSDEVYQFLSFTDEFPSSLYEYDDPLNPSVFAINSFSKILGPGLRMGWLCTAQPHMQRLLDCGSLQSGGGFNPFTSVIISEMMDNGMIIKQTNTAREHFRAGCTVLCKAIEKYLRPALKQGEDLTYHYPTGGFFCFINLPQRFDADQLLQVAKKKGVSYFCGKHSSPDKSAFKNCIRLCFAYVDEQIEEGVQRLAEAIKEY